MSNALKGGILCGLLSLAAIAVASYAYPVWWTSPWGLVASSGVGVLASLVGISFFGRLDG